MAGKRRLAGLRSKTTSDQCRHVAE
jgi:hypothetical protein